MSKLKRCPFCGDNVDIVPTGLYHWKYAIHHKNKTECILDANAFTLPYEEEDAVRMWNTRADLKTESNSEKPNNSDEPQTENPCDGCVCDDGKHLMYCMNCKGIAWKTEPPKVEDEPQTDCYVSDLCKHYGDKQICGRCRSRNLFCEAEPQPRCPKCGKRGYIRSLESMGVKLKVFDEYKWKCTNCNKYFKEEPKDEPQTERSE